EQLLAQRDRVERVPARPPRCAARGAQRRGLRVAPDLDADAPPADVRRMPARRAARGRIARSARDQSAVEREAGRMNTRRNRICVVTGSRAEYGLLYWVLHDLC